jgi:leucine dehydrogenase
MSVHILDAMAREGFESFLALHDRKSGLRAFLGVHDTTRGPAFGGVRRWEYRDERGALLDCLRLARAMTHKCALLDLPAGGAKVVVLDREGVDWEAAYRAIGRAVEGMSGRFYTGPDVGTGERELSWMSGQTGYVTDPGPAGPGELAACTAEGVFRGIEAALTHLDGEADWGKRAVAVQGLGAVGWNLAERLIQVGATVYGTDVMPDRVDLAQERMGVVPLRPGEEISRGCDVLAPCAMGGMLHDLSVERLKCRIVAGGANNVLAKPLHGDRLHEREILYVPDFVVNAGALIRGTIFHLEGRREPVGVVGERVGAAVTSVLERAKDAEEPPARTAATLADERIASWRAESDS